MCPKKNFSRRSVATVFLARPVFSVGDGSFYFVPSTIVQVVFRGFASREFASRSPLAMKFANLSDTMSACAPPFSLQGFPTFVGHISSYCCARHFDIVES